MYNPFNNSYSSQSNNQNKQDCENGSNCQIKDYCFKRHPGDDLYQANNLNDRQLINNNQSEQGRDQLKIQPKNPNRGQTFQHQNNHRNNLQSQDQQNSNNLQKQEYKDLKFICKLGEDCHNNACPFYHPNKGELNHQQIKPLNKTVRSSANRESSKDTTNTFNTEQKRPNYPCKHGDQCFKKDCTFIHKKDKEFQQPCMFGNKCKRENCFYQHPQKNISQGEENNQNILGIQESEKRIEKKDFNPNCKYGDKCFKKDCQKIHIQQEKQNKTKNSPEQKKDNDQGCSIKKDFNFSHKKQICKFGKTCKRENCQFKHTEEYIPSGEENNQNILDIEKKDFNPNYCKYGDKCFKKDCQKIHIQQEKQNQIKNFEEEEKKDNNQGCFINEMKKLQNEENSEQTVIQSEKQKVNTKMDKKKKTEVLNPPKNNQQREQFKITPPGKKDDDHGGLVDGIKKMENEEQMVIQQVKPIKKTKKNKKKKDGEQLQNSLINKKSEIKSIPIYYLDQVKINNNLPSQQKCHWFDLFGKCDKNRCNYAHDFKPLFYCENIKEGKQCSESLPIYIQKHFEKYKHQAYSCNNPDQYKKRIDCHDYCLEGVCSTIICKKFHKKFEKKCPNPNVGNCPDCQKRTSEIKLKIHEIAQYLTEQFQFSGEKFQRKLEKIQHRIPFLREEVKGKETIDILFIVDCTGSMQRWINFVHEKIESIIQGFQEKYPNFQKRFSFVGYRDFDDEKVQAFDFSEDLAKFKEHIQKIKGIGGGDFAEDMISGLKHGLNQDFRSTVKAAFLFYDAPNHGKNYHDGDISDNYLDIKDRIEDYIQQFAQRDIYFTQIMLKKQQHLKYYAQKTFNAIQNEYIKNGKDQHIFNYQTSEDPNKSVENFILQTLDSSVQRTKNSGNIKKTPSGMKENPVLKNLQFNKEIRFNFLNQFIRQDIPTQWNDPFIIEEASSFNYKIQIQQQSTKGSSRIAFNGLDHTSQKKIVVKFDQQITENPDQNLQHMKDQIKSQVISSHLVEIFRKSVLPYVSSLESLPYYISSKIAVFEDNFCYVESFLEGFDKFSNNAYFQKEAQSENQLLLECLPHFSFQYTQGYLMLCDLQGRGPILTDPCIHTFNSIGYGQTNLGMQGMALYFMKHKCNEFCDKLNLVHPESFQNLGEDYDYHKQITEQVKDVLIFIKNQKEITKYKERPLFCQLCEDEEIKNTEKQQNLLEFVESICAECETSAKEKTNTYCTMCGGQFKFSEYELKRNRGNQNGRCQACNKYSDLMDIFKYYNSSEESDRFELSFRVLTKS